MSGEWSSSLVVDFIFLILKKKMSKLKLVKRNYNFPKPAKYKYVMDRITRKDFIRTVASSFGVEHSFAYFIVSLKFKAENLVSLNLRFCLLKSAFNLSLRFVFFFQLLRAVEEKKHKSSSFAMRLCSRFRSISIFLSNLV